MDESGAHIAEVYASALFELAKEAGAAEAVNDDLTALAQVAASQKEFLTLNVSPYFDRQYKLELLQKLFAGKITELTMNFLLISSKHNRIAYLTRIAQDYEKLYNSDIGVQDVSVTVAKVMTEDEIRSLGEQIAQAVKHRVKLEVKIDASIIGGIIIRRGDVVIDNTVKRELQELAKSITNRQKIQEGINEV
jgi:F-type H+-transporting ATPase subunit delta